jgi:hypothetical protein
MWCRAPRWGGEFAEPAVRVGFVEVDLDLGFEVVGQRFLVGVEAEVVAADAGLLVARTGVPQGRKMGGGERSRRGAGVVGR